MAQFLDEPAESDQFEEETPVEDVEEEAGEPELVRIRLNGKTVMVTADVADAIQAREDAFQRKLSEQGAELGRYRAQQAPKTETQQTDPADEDLEFYSSPSKAWAKREARLREEFEQTLSQRETLKAQREAYWAKFYSDHKEFVGREKLVNAVVASEYDRLANLDPAEAQTELALHLHSLLGTEPEKGTGAVKMTDRKVTAERGSSAPQRGTQKPAKKSDMTLSEAIRQRAEARRRATYQTKDN